MVQVTIEIDINTLEKWQDLAKDTSAGDVSEMVIQAVACLADLEYGHNDADLLGVYLNDGPSVAELELLPSEMSKVLLEFLTTHKPSNADEMSVPLNTTKIANIPEDVALKAAHDKLVELGIHARKLSQL